jgi:Lar family restriction alleviation protein
MKKEIELKPCPFCGGKGAYYYLRIRNKRFDHGVCCAPCHFRAGSHETKEDAIAAWNQWERESREGKGGER